MIQTISALCHRPGVSKPSRIRFAISNTIPRVGAVLPDFGLVQAIAPLNLAEVGNGMRVWDYDYFRIKLNTSDPTEDAFTYIAVPLSAWQ